MGDTEVSQRYTVLQESKTSHCCFVASVLDTQRLDSLGEPDVVCECFDADEAKRIADALNAASWKLWLIKGGSYWSTQFDIVRAPDEETARQVAGASEGDEVQELPVEGEAAVLWTWEHSPDSGPYSENA